MVSLIRLFTYIVSLIEDEIKNGVFHFLQINLFQPIVLLEEAWRNSAHNSCWFLAKALCCLIQEALKKKSLCWI